MKKLYWFYIGVLSIAFIKLNFAVPPTLKFLATKAAFDFKRDPKQRERLKEALEKRDPRVIDGFEFEDQVFEDINLSGFNFRDVKLKGAILKNVRLKGALLYGDTPEEK